MDIRRGHRFHDRCRRLVWFASRAAHRRLRRATERVARVTRRLEQFECRLDVVRDDRGRAERSHRSWSNRWDTGGASLIIEPTPFRPGYVQGHGAHPARCLGRQGQGRRHPAGMSAGAAMVPPSTRPSICAARSRWRGAARPLPAARAVEARGAAGGARGRRAVSRVIRRELHHRGMPAGRWRLSRELNHAH